LISEEAKNSIVGRVGKARARIAAAAREAGREEAEITLSAATKTQSAETVRAVIQAGVSVCGENRVQEMTEKLAQNAYGGARLHFIGRLQTNKVKYVVGRVALIESVDSERLLKAVEAQAKKLGVVQDILLEVNIGGEESKGGISPEELLPLAKLAAGSEYVRLRGLMCIPPPAQKPGGNRAFFAAALKLYVDLRIKIEDNISDMDCLSMGMSEDFEDAVREGATLVRLGTALFGPRPPYMGQAPAISQ
jgi:pyridoxal phosphate enzyme (YggS family)